MEHLPIRLVAFDLDGTILDRNKNITPRTRAALFAAAEKGVALCPATGRTLANLTMVEMLPGLLPYALTSNGAAVWALGSRPMDAVRSRWGENIGTAAGVLPPDSRCIVLEGLSAAKAQEVNVCLKPFLPGNLKAFMEGRSVSERPSYEWEQSHGSAGFRPGPGLSTVVPDLAAELAAHDGTVEKFCMFFRDLDTLRAARTALEKITDIEIVQGSPDNLEVTAPSVDKGFGLRQLCRQLNIPVAQALAVGDSENDWGMLRAAGCAAAVANATPQTKALADYVTAADNDHDAVAELIEKLVL